MKIPRLTMLTLGVGNLDKAVIFYEAVLDTHPNTSYSGMVFIGLPGTWISLYPLEKLASDIAQNVQTCRDGFGGLTLAYNADSKDEVIAVIEGARLAGAKLTKEAQETF